MVRNYYNEFNYTINHVSIYENNDYKVTIYKNENCLDELNLTTAKINLTECINKLGLKNPIFIVTENYKDRYTVNFSIYDSETLSEIIIEEQCAGTNFSIVKNIKNAITDPQCLYWMYEDKQDVTNIKSKLYTDICYFAESIEKKDMSLTDRIKKCFPNYSLCEDNCYEEVTDIETFNTTCKCSTGKKYTKELISLVDQNGFLTNTNLSFLKCPKTFFDQILENPAFYIFSTFLLLGIIYTLVYFLKKNKPIDIYIIKLDYQVQKHIENEKKQKKKEEEKKVKETRKKFSVQYEKAEAKRIEFQNKRKKTMKKEKGKLKEKKISGKNEPPKKESNKRVMFNEKGEEDQKTDKKLLKSIKEIHKIPLGKSIRNDSIDIFSSNYNVMQKNNRKKHTTLTKKLINNNKKTINNNINQNIIILTI